jgi:phosphatidylinositol alpha-1,6-mannosyltransferase
MPRPAGSRRHASRRVLLSEWFPPALGGSGELLRNVYGRMAEPTDVITVPAVDPSEREWPLLRVDRRTFGASLGVMDPASLVAHLRLARTVRAMTTVDAVVHCGRALPEGTIAMLACAGFGVPGVGSRGAGFVCWTHGEELPIAASSRELSWLLRRVHRRAAALLANSHNTARLLVALGNAPSNVHVVHPGVDVSRFTPDARRDDVRRTLLPRGGSVLLTVGRLQARKGHDLVLRALAQPAAGSWTYVVIGDGPERARLEGLARDLGIGDRVRFLGQVDPADLPACYASADLFAHPNRVEGADFEGFGIVFLEAAASGLAVIGGRSGGVPEAVADGRTGVLVSGTDAEELARVLGDLAANPDRRADMGRAGRQRAIEDFTWDRAARQVEAIERDIRAASRR